MAEPPEYNYLARHTLTLAMMDSASFATIAKKLKSEITNYNPDEVEYSNTLIGLIMFSMMVQVRTNTIDKL